jgi:hypothetical protein
LVTFTFRKCPSHPRLKAEAWFSTSRPTKNKNAIKKFPNNPSPWGVSLCTIRLNHSVIFKLPMPKEEELSEGFVATRTLA